MTRTSSAPRGTEATPFWHRARSAASSTSAHGALLGRLPSPTCVRRYLASPGRRTGLLMMRPSAGFVELLKQCAESGQSTVAPPSSSRRRPTCTTSTGSYRSACTSIVGKMMKNRGFRDLLQGGNGVRQFDRYLVQRRQFAKRRFQSGKCDVEAFVVRVGIVVLFTISRKLIRVWLRAHSSLV
uniref:Uncharacterized protein n=1 Tax=Ixodes ricinus TaxID=34613 RepID=A0A0K8R308_IXORI